MNAKFGSLTTMAGIAGAAARSESTIAPARVRWAIAAYFGWARKVISPGPASSSPHAPRTRTEPSPRTAPPTRAARSARVRSMASVVPRAAVLLLLLFVVFVQAGQDGRRDVHRRVVVEHRPQGVLRPGEFGRFRLEGALVGPEDEIDLLLLRHQGGHLARIGIELGPEGLAGHA